MFNVFRYLEHVLVSAPSQRLSIFTKYTEPSLSTRRCVLTFHITIKDLSLKSDRKIDTGKLFDEEILILYLMVKTTAYSHKISTQYIHKGKGLLEDTEGKKNNVQS